MVYYLATVGRMSPNINYNYHIVYNYVTYIDYMHNVLPFL